MSVTYAVPGVYVEESNARALSIQSGETAVPVFIGHFNSIDGTPLKGCVPVQSWLAFTKRFGASDTITIDASNNEVKDTMPHLGSYSVRLYFENGGGPCYVLHLSGQDETQLNTMAEAIEQCPDITLLVWCERTEKDVEVYQKLGTLLGASATSGGNRGMFLLFDAQATDGQNTDFIVPQVTQPTQVATYFPALATGYVREVSNAGVTVTEFNHKKMVTDVGVSEEEVQKLTLATLQRAIALWEGKAKESGNVAQAGKTKVDALQKIYDKLCQKDADVALGTVTSEQQQEMINAGVANGGAGKPTLATVKDKITSLRKQATNSESVKKANALQEIYDNFRQRADAGVKLETATSGQKEAMTEADLPGDALGSLTLKNLKEKIIFWEDKVEKGVNAAEKAKQNAKVLQETYDKCRTAAQQNIAGSVIARASAAMAGVIARVDRERGVWKAPANVALVGVTELVSVLQDGKAEPIRLDDALNGRLVDNKINAIRAFHGQGIKVWGAHTMADLNQTAWRYISVRRLFNAVERDARATLRTMVFEPNNAPTWEAVRSALDHYLFALWRKGALQGETPAQAYFVQIGLGVTMIPDDAANGRMIAKVGMAAVRPAEFIVLQFTQDMVPS